MDIALHTSGLHISGEDPAGLSLGGAESAVVWMARALGRQGHRVTVYCNTDGEREQSGVSYLPEGALPRQAPARRWDVFLAARFAGVLDGPVHARLLGLWHHDPPCAETVEVLRRMLPRADFSFFLSRFQRDEYERWLPGISASAVVTSNGVDFESLNRVRDEAGEARRSAPRFLYGSRPSCGLEPLLQEIWPRIRGRLPEAELVVTSYDVSSLPDPERLVRARRSEEVYQRLVRASPGVRRIGPLRRCDFWREMARADCVLYPTDTPEVSCLVALEAQALGVPIVTTARFALPETIAFHEGLVAAAWGTPEYADELAAKACRCIEDRGFARRAREAGLGHVTPRTHSWDALARTWTGLFRRRLQAAGGVGEPAA